MDSVLKRTLGFSGAIALSAFMATAAFAGPTKPTNANHALATSAKVVTASANTGSFLDELKLTNAQKTKLRTIRAERAREIKVVLTPAQRTKYEQAQQSHQKLSQTLKDLGLNPAQSKKVLAILQKSNAEIRATLTPDQQKKMDAYLKQQGNAPTAVQ